MAGQILVLFLVCCGILLAWLCSCVCNYTQIGSDCSSKKEIVRMEDLVGVGGGGRKLGEKGVGELGEGGLWGRGVEELRRRRRR